MKDRPYKNVMEEFRAAKEQAEKDRMDKLIANWNKKYPNGMFVIMVNTRHGTRRLFWFKERGNHPSRMPNPSIACQSGDERWSFAYHSRSDNKHYSTIEKFLAGCKRLEVPEQIVAEFVQKYERMK